MIEIRHLKTLQASRSSGSLATVATTLHQAQFALFHRFSDPGQRLNLRLSIHRNQPPYFTPWEEILLQLASQVLPQINHALQACNGPQQTRLRTVIEYRSCIQQLTPALENFHANWPQTEINFKFGMTLDSQPALQQDELDLMSTSNILLRSGSYYSPMFDFEVHLVLVPDHPLTSKAQVTSEDLASRTLLIHLVQRGRPDVWRHFLRPAGVNPSLKSMDNTLLLIQMVTARMGIVALLHRVAEGFGRQDLVMTRTLGDGLWNRLYAAIRDDEQ